MQALSRSNWIRFAAAVLVLIPLSLVLNRRLMDHVEGPSFFLTVGNADEGVIKIYWDTGSGFAEAQTASKNIGRYRTQVLRFPLPQNLEILRVDVDGIANSLLVRDARIGYFRWPASDQLIPTDWKAVHDVSVTPQYGSSMIWEFPARATDPHLHLLRSPETFQLIHQKRAELLLWLDIATILCTLVASSTLLFRRRL